MSIDELPEILTVAELAKFLRQSRNSAYALVAAGAIRSVRVGERAIRVPKGALIDFLQNGDAAQSDDASPGATPIRQERSGHGRE